MYAAQHRSHRRAAPWRLVPALAAGAVALGGCQSASTADEPTPVPEPGTADPAEQTGEVVDSLRALELDRLQALVDADMPAVEAALADSFRLIPPPGIDLSREEYVGALAAGDLDYLVFEPVSDIEVDLSDDGDLAVMTYRSRIHMDAGGQGEFEHEAWHTYVYRQGPDGWQLTWEQATAVGGFPP